VSGISYSGPGAPPSVSYGYDVEDKQTSVTDSTGTSTRTYDPFQELTSGTSGGSTVSYSYDADGNTTGITYPLPAAATWAASHTVGYSYDKAGQLASVTDFGGKKIAITTTSDGQPASVTLGSTGDTIGFAYGQDNNPSSITLTNASATTLQGFAYSYAPDGEILSETDTPATASPSLTYSYDARGEVASATPSGGTATHYGYDASGDLLTLPTGASAVDSSGNPLYGGNGELESSTLSGTTTGYSYDADGNRTSSTQGTATVTSATWDGLDQLTGYTSAAGSMSGAAYDDSGNRISATFTTSAGTAAQRYVWNGDGLLMDATNAYIYAGSQNTPAEQVNLATGRLPT
jgi:YD repeat-containing protein